MCILMLVVVSGCESDSKEPHAKSLRERQDDALKDPMNYSPQVEDRSDISGGGMTDFKKDAFKRDMKSVFDP
jgi:hypothetical protein